MRRAQDLVFEAVDRVSGDRYRVDPTDHPDDLLELLAASGWFRLRPIEPSRRDAPGPDHPTHRAKEERLLAGSSRRSARVRSDVA